MLTRPYTTLALAATGALALAIAGPAYACGEECHRAHLAAAKVEKSTAPAKSDAVPAAPQRIAGGCNCATDGKCTCPKGECKCKDCPVNKAKAAPRYSANDCDCEKGGKNCTCPKGQCKCDNCHEPKSKS